MKEKKVLQNAFEWVRPDPTFPPRKPETRTPVFWLDTNSADEYFFINDSDETLAFVASSTGGFVTEDGGVSSFEGVEGVVYEHVKPGMAVKVDQYCRILDSDYMLFTEIYVQSEKRGRMRFQTPPEKGKLRQHILLWDNGDSGKWVVYETNA